jgi:hypothetical protein
MYDSMGAIIHYKKKTVTSPISSGGEGVLRGI